MNFPFIKFPSTPHLAVLPGASIRDDKVISKLEQIKFLSHFLTIEEKIDGANLGISFDSGSTVIAQNRGNQLDFPQVGQWHRFQKLWIELRPACTAVGSVRPRSTSTYQE